MIKVFVTILFVLISTSNSIAQFSRNYSFVEDLDVFPEPQALNFYQREKVTLTYNVLRDNQPINMTDTGIISVWEVTSRTNPITAVIVVTSEVVNATGGVIRFTLEPNRAGVPEGKYDGFVRMFKKVGADFVESGMIQRQNVDIRRSPPSEGINFIGPTWWDRYDPNYLSVDELVVTRIAATQIELGGVLYSTFPTSKVYSIADLNSSAYPFDSLTKSLIADGTGPQFRMYKIAGESGISTFYTNNVLVISGNATGSVNQLFPVVPGKVAVYFRGAMGTQQITPLSPVQNQLPANLTTDGTNVFWTQGAVASDTPLFDGNPPSYYRNFQNHTNFYVFNGNLDPEYALINTDPSGIEVQGNLGIIMTNRVVGGVTSPVVRIINSVSLATNVAALLSSTNLWLGYNTFEHGIRVNNRIRMGGLVGGNIGLYSSVGIGGSNNIASGPYSTVVGGRDSVASGQDSISGGRGTVASGDDSVALGRGALAGGYSSIAIGRSATARGSYSTIIGGNNNDVSVNATALGGEFMDIDGNDSWGFGSRMFVNHQRNYAFGDGNSTTNPISSGRDYAFWLDSNTTNQYFFGLNTNKPSVAGAVMQVVGGPAIFESLRFADGSIISSATNIGAGNVSLTSAWSVVYSDGQTNSISLRLGESNSVLVSMGSNAAPRFVKDGLGGGTITSITADVNYFVVTGSTGPATVISLNATAATNLWKGEQAYNYVPGIQNVSGRVASVESGLGNVSGRVVTIEGYLPGIANISGRVVSAESNIGNVSGRVVTIEGYLPGIANVSGRVVNLESNLGNVSGRVVTIEGWTTDNLPEGLTNKYADDWSRYAATQTVNFALQSATNILELDFTTNSLSNPLEGGMRWNEDFETVMVGLHGGYALPIGESVVYPVVNQTGSQINKGTLVSAAGTLGNSGKILVEPAFTNTNMPSHMIMGVVPADIPNGDQGYAVHFGRVRGLNMTNYSEGAVLYANPSVAGGFTTNVPLAPNPKTIVALVVNNSQNQGTIWVRPTLGSSLANDELVNLGTLTTNDTIVYDYAAKAFTNRTLGSSAFVGTNTFINLINGTGTVNALSAGGIRITGTVNTNDLKSVPTLETLATYNPLGAVTNATLLSLSGTPYNGILNLDPTRFSTNMSGELTVEVPPSINATNTPSGAGEILVSSDNTKSNLYFTKATIFSAFEIDINGRLMPRASTNFFDAFWALDGNGDLYPVAP